MFVHALQTADPSPSVLVSDNLCTIDSPIIRPLQEIFRPFFSIRLRRHIYNAFPRNSPHFRLKF